jgi:hypothetical protein
MNCVRFVVFAVGVLAAPLLSVPASAVEVAPHAGAGSDARPLERTRFTFNGQALPERPRYRPRPSERAARKGVTPPVGTEREWLGLDDTTGKLYAKKYKLRRRSARRPPGTARRRPPRGTSAGMATRRSR